ncbi:hypothetical protein MMUR_03190 [Mycolicibacterium murale]|uniref:Uncharacterized protein n=1 Tax=Mycolicibacterium murale TaxID=182220 RepID=A0A7I9WEL9_9MYCO|nr:hypothetical protein MMUR_03190 [Mycolicibacterium murale]
MRQYRSAIGPPIIPNPTNNVAGSLGGPSVMFTPIVVYGPVSGVRPGDMYGTFVIPLP